MINKNIWLSICIVILVFIVLSFLAFSPAMAAEGQPAATDKTAAVGNQTDLRDTTPAVKDSQSPKEPPIVIGLNAPELGPYGREGKEQRQAAEMAVEEINAGGGIMGREIKLIARDSKSNPRIAKENAIELIDKENAGMLFGGVSSAAALVTAKIVRVREKIFFATSSFSSDITTEEGHKYLFRECFDSRMAAKVLSGYLNKNFAGKKYFYITVDYSWGSTTEESFRKITGTSDKFQHRSFLTKLGTDDFKSVLKLAEELESNVLVLVLFGMDLEAAIKQAYDMGLKKKMQVVAPILSIDTAINAGPEAMEGILGTTAWFWKLSFDENHAKGMEFIKKYENKYGRYPSEAAASAYIIPYQYKEAVERAKTFDTLPVVNALEDHKYTGMKDEQQWRAFDHQSIQTVYAVKCKKASEVEKDKYKMDFFEVINKMNGGEAAITKEEWVDVREAVGALSALEE